MSAMGHGQYIAVSYKNYFIVECSDANSTFILDCSNSQWYRAQPWPERGYRMTGDLIEENWYVSAL